MSALYSPLRESVQHNNIGRNARANVKPNHDSEVSPTSLLNKPSAPIAEIDDDIDDREVVNTPYPGVDDGFFNGTENNKDDQPDVETIDPKRPKTPNPDVEFIPAKPKDPEPIEPSDEIPHRRNDPDGENKPDDFDGKSVGSDHPRPRRPFFPHFPGFGPDLEVGSIPGEIPSSIPDVNIYQHKKTLAQGMMDLALFSANANQMRYVLESYNRHPYFYPSIVFISFSLILQVAVGIGLIWNATYNVKDEKEICVANKINNFTVIAIFLVTVVNVFISAFGVANPQT